MSSGALLTFGYFQCLLECLAIRPYIKNMLEPSLSPLYTKRAGDYETPLMILGSIWSFPRDL